MNPAVLTSLIERLDQLKHLVSESPYLSTEFRKEFENEILKISEKLKEGTITFSNGEKILADLNKKAVSAEIESLIKKIGDLNPSSPRLQTLREFSSRLNHGEISSDQARQGVLSLMKG